MCDGIARLLRRAGYTVSTAESGKQAWTMLYTGLPDLIVLDLMMREVGGVTFLRMLRSHHHWNRVPVLVITGLDHDESLVQEAQPSALLMSSAKGATASSNCFSGLATFSRRTPLYRLPHGSTRRFRLLTYTSSYSLSHRAPMEHAILETFEGLHSATPLFFSNASLLGGDAIEAFARPIQDSYHKRMTRIKICGICRAEDAAMAVTEGADALGMMLTRGIAGSVSVEEGLRIVAGVPAFVPVVGLFVDSGTEEILKTARELALSAVQLHGDETPEEVAALRPVRVIKALRIGAGGIYIGALERSDQPAAAHESFGDFAGDGECWRCCWGNRSGERLGWRFVR